MVFQDTLVILDVSDSEDPEVVGHVGLPGTALGIAASAGYAYVPYRHRGGISNGYDYGVQVIDVSNSTSPRKVRSVPLSDSPRSVAVSGSYVYPEDRAGTRPSQTRSCIILQPSLCI